MAERPEPAALWARLRTWADRWQLPPPQISPGWINLPPSFKPLAKPGSMIERPLFEPPATDQDADRLEHHIGLPLPQDLRELYAVHDGSYAPLLPYGMSLLGYEAITTTWNMFAELADQFQSEPVLADDGTHYDGVYHRAWLPVAASDDMHMVLDLIPGPAGAYGHALMLVNECDFVLVGRSLRDFLDRWLTALDQGRAVFDADYGYAVPVPDEADYIDFLRLDSTLPA